jgi:hypothetical protein
MSKAPTSGSRCLWSTRRLRRQFVTPFCPRRCPPATYRSRRVVSLRPTARSKSSVVSVSERSRVTCSCLERTKRRRSPFSGPHEVKFPRDRDDRDVRLQPVSLDRSYARGRENERTRRVGPPTLVRIRPCEWELSCVGRGWTVLGPHRRFFRQEPSQRAETKHDSVIGLWHPPSVGTSAHTG